MNNQSITPQNSSEIFKRFQIYNPDPKTELVYSSPFELLIAVMLSAQATDISVNKATKPLFKKVNTPEAFILLGEEGLKLYIKTINFFHTKARHIIQTCELLVQNFEGKVPASRADLETLPGVGRKTANVILNSAFGEPTLAVDTHIFRVAHRLGLSSGKTPLEVELALLSVISSEFLKEAHHYLVLHGRYICKARHPLCAQCFLSDLCPSYTPS